MQALLEALTQSRNPNLQDIGDMPPAQLLEVRPTLQDLHNALSGVAAGTAGLPVDLMTTVMRPFGYDVQRPVGGSEWMGEQLGADPESGAFIGGTFGSPDPMDGARLAQHFPDLIGAMTVFHGSPHKWDKVDLSKVGTGEGAQAYGHGFYAAENKGVASEYQAMGRPKNASIRPEDGGYRVTYKDRQGRDYDLGKFGSKEEADAALNSASGNLYELDLPDETIAKMLDWDKPLSEQPEVAERIIPGFSESAGRYRAISERMDELSYQKGGLDSPEWNALRDEAKGIRDKLGFAPNATGEEFYRHLVKQQPRPPAVTGSVSQMRQGFNPQAEASAKLRELGIPGIRYLDGTSRSAGEGTRNFVVFDEQYIKPLTRNGQPIAP